MSDNGEQTPKKRQPYPDDAVVLALSVIRDGGSLRQACRAVGREFGKEPHASTVHDWAQNSKEAIAALQPEERRQWQILAGQVYTAWANRALEAATARKEDGSYAVSHTQVMVPFGIAKDAVKVIEDTVNPRSGNMMNVQFNLVTRGEVIEGEAQEKG